MDAVILLRACLHRLIAAALGAGALAALTTGPRVLAQPADAVGTAPPTEAPSAPYWRDGWRGWHFYEAPAAEATPPKAASQAEQRAPSPPRTTEPSRPAELVEFERLQKAVEDYRHIAIMRPTEANVRRYMALESQVVSQASRFADVAQRIAWTTPSLDPSLQGRPVNAKALEVFEAHRRLERSQSVAALAKDHVLLFFYRSDCPYCHAFGPVLQAFERHHGLKVVAIGIDGGPLPGFPHARADNGTARTLQVTQVPAVFLAQPYSGRISPVGYGVLSEAQLLERIAALVSPPTEAALTPPLQSPPQLVAR